MTKMFIKILMREKSRGCFESNGGAVESISILSLSFLNMEWLFSLKCKMSTFEKGNTSLEGKNTFSTTISKLHVT